MSSAFVGEPPNTQQDIDIIKGLLYNAGLPTDNYQHGLLLPPAHAGHTSTDNKGPGIIAGCCIAIATIIFVTTLRLIHRRLSHQSIWGWDDWMIIPAALVAIVWMVIAIVMVPTAKIGRHVYTLTYQDVYYLFYYSGIDRTVFFVAVSFVKISIICFNWRLTGISSFRWKIVHSIFLFLVITFMMVNIFGFVFDCSIPGADYSISKIGQNVGSIKCRNANVLGEGLRITHIIFDFALLTVPIIVIAKIKMRTRKKIQLCALFCVGALSCVSAVVSTVLQIKVTTDISYEFNKQMGWTVVDLVFALIVASLPALNSLFEKILHSGDSSWTPESSSKVSTLLSSSGHKTVDAKQEKAEHDIYRQDDIELAITSSDTVSSGKVGESQGHGMT